MSRRSSRVTVGSAEVLEVIREETSAPSSINIDDKKESDRSEPKYCPCEGVQLEEIEKRHAEEIERLLSAKELELEEKFKQKLHNEVQYLKDRFGFVLQNEQVRASYMLREAHRERQEKISALQTQLECKNLAGLMYVMCSERRKSKMEILRITEEYVTYIQSLQNILEESQALILNLSRGYKTAARVDDEWRKKMKKILKHFQSFVFEFVGGSPENNQYFFNIPELLKTKTSIKDNPEEDPCENEEEESEPKIEREKEWWETLDCQEHPFVMFGDMADFNPPQRREVLRNVKAAKTAPKKWKEYVFNEMFVKRECTNADIIKDMWCAPASWECAVAARQTPSRCSESQSRRITTTSVDIKGNMGSILKIMTSSTPKTTAKATLLGARDSMEIASTTRLRDKHRSTVDHGKVVLNIGNKIDSFFNKIEDDHEDEDVEREQPENVPHAPGPQTPTAGDTDDVESDEESTSNLGSVHHDSLQIIQSHVPDHDSKINYEKTCPMEKCQRTQVDSFIRSLPKYMQANPFTHFEQTYDDYEACSPEQLEILKKRIEEKKRREKMDFQPERDPLLSWTPSVDGVEVQTSDISLMPPCTCLVPSPSLASSTTKVYNVADLIPIKQTLDKIKAECFFHDDIEFNRFKVLGQTESEDLNYEREIDSSKNRLTEIKAILKKHPSLCEIFQANTRC
ncbi:uncharacterized protein LOC116774671 isoform X1 [Danaus plexippus]|uniref:uncharacterized protein LOC116774671 isoform X1 n=1 Tax=Danaus plexippus TaxID=13037 RepID=UPI002AB0420B|nr:uncharacterized protein LOC116774671 isoform X1 [Danaus plexippus]